MSVGAAGAGIGTIGRQAGRRPFEDLFEHAFGIFFFVRSQADADFFTGRGIPDETDLSVGTAADTREAKIHTKPQHRPQDRERSVFIAISKKGNAKEYSNYPTTALISQASKVRLKILQARLQQYVN